MGVQWQRLLTILSVLQIEKVTATKKKKVLHVSSF